MNIYNPNKKIESRNKREWRRFVLDQCIKQDMYLKEPFNSYPYKTKMYPAIKYIADIAPPEWDWDKLTVRDIIRTICLDRIPTINRRDKNSDDNKKTDKPVAKSQKKVDNNVPERSSDGQRMRNSERARHTTKDATQHWTMATAIGVFPQKTAAPRKKPASQQQKLVLYPTSPP
jgi:hypothetical protein